MLWIKSTDSIDIHLPRISFYGMNQWLFSQNLPWNAVRTCTTAETNALRAGHPWRIHDAAGLVTRKHLGSMPGRDANPVSFLAAN
jgi:hypothetical protein